MCGVGRGGEREWGNRNIWVLLETEGIPSCSVDLTPCQREGHGNGFAAVRVKSWVYSVYLKLPLFLCASRGKTSIIVMHDVYSRELVTYLFPTEPNHMTSNCPSEMVLPFPRCNIKVTVSLGDDTN